MGKGATPKAAAGHGNRFEALWRAQGFPNQNQFATELKRRYSLSDDLASLVSKISRFKQGKIAATKTVPLWIVFAADLLRVPVLSLISDRSSNSVNELPSTEREKAALAAELLGYDAATISRGLDMVKEGASAILYLRAIEDASRTPPDHPKSRTVTKRAS